MNLARHPHDQVRDFSWRTGIRDPRVDAYINNYDLHRRYGVLHPGVSHVRSRQQVVRPQRYDVGVDLAIPGADYSVLQTFWWASGQYYMLGEHDPFDGGTFPATTTSTCTASRERQARGRTERLSPEMEAVAGMGWRNPIMEGFARGLLGQTAICMGSRGGGIRYPWERVGNRDPGFLCGDNEVDGSWRSAPLKLAHLSEGGDDE